MEQDAQGINVDEGLWMRVWCYHAILLLFSPIALGIAVANWVLYGMPPRETYWKARPAPKKGLPKLREEQKWPYVRFMEGRIAELEGLLETTDVVVRRKVNAALERVDFVEMLRPMITARVAAAALEIRPEPVPVRSVVQPPEAVVEAETPPVVAEKEVMTVPAGAVGEAVAAAAMRHIESTGGLDPELDAALARLRAGGGDTE